jgi:hypothetical protein
MPMQQLDSGLLMPSCLCCLPFAISLMDAGFRASWPWLTARVVWAVAHQLVTLAQTPTVNRHKFVPRFTIKDQSVQPLYNSTHTPLHSARRWEGLSFLFNDFERTCIRISAACNFLYVLYCYDWSNTRDASGWQRGNVCYIMGSIVLFWACIFF